MRKPKILTRLRVDEISSVDRGAGDGVHILLMKRADSTPQRPTIGQMFDSIDFDKLSDRIQPQQDSNDDITLDDEHTPKLPEKPEHLSSITKTKEPIMTSRTEELHSIAKDFGVAKLAKLLVTEGNAHGITEVEFTKLIDDEAQKTRMPGERPGSAFSRYFTSPENVELRKAHALTKNTPAPVPLMEITPVSVEVGSSATVDDSAKAYDQLMALVEVQRKLAPTLTTAQLFERVFSAPENATLAAKAHRRPSATTSFAMPS